MPEKSYNYPGQPLQEIDDQIRLLTLHPGQWHDPIHCSLRNGVRKDIEQAEALSYAWGQPPATRMIWINDLEFAVRDNLQSALQQLRLSDQIRTLWVDALCVNPSDVQERNHQVQHMTHIFGYAKTLTSCVRMGIGDVYGS